MIEVILPNTLWIRKHFITSFGSLLQVYKNKLSFSAVFRRLSRNFSQSPAYFCSISCIFSGDAGFCPSPLPLWAISCTTRRSFLPKNQALSAYFCHFLQLVLANPAYIEYHYSRGNNLPPAKSPSGVHNDFPSYSQGLRGGALWVCDL